MDELVDAERARRAGRADPRRGPGAAREGRAAVDDAPPTTDDERPLGARAPTSRSPQPPFWGAREIEVDLDDVYPHLDRHVLFKLHWGGRGKKGEEWRRIVEGHDGEEGFAPQARADVARAGLPQPAGPARLLPLRRRRQRAGRLRSRGPRTRARAAGLPAPAEARPDLPDRLLPPARDSSAGERDVVALQGVTVGPEVTERIEKLEADGEFAEQLFTHGLGVQAAEGLAEWLHSRGPQRARHRARPGPALLLGLPGLPGPVRAREGLAPARPRADRDDASPTATR